MANDRTIFDEPHYQSLEFLAAHALVKNNFFDAFRLADRRCRILPFPEPHCYVLRGEASFRMGARKAAIADVAKALELAPEHIAANRRMLAWAKGPRKMHAAIALVANEHDFAVLRHAIQAISTQRRKDFANAIILEDKIEGWAVWSVDAPLEISISDCANRTTTLFRHDLLHPLADCGHAVSFSVNRPKSETPQSIRLSVAGKTLYAANAVGRTGASTPQVYRPHAKTRRGNRVTVIVPIYGDYRATRLCLESLLQELHLSNHRALLINDATPDPRIQNYLATVARKSCVEVLVNAHNLGFVGSINRGLEQVKQGDVILLNSDTIVPRGFVNRLSAAAHSSTDIGTVTPLSNNGEFTSFPKPYTANPLGTHRDVQRLDKIAAQLHKGKVIDIPSGIGFCLYVTRTCLDKVGVLSADFASGYLEDADFCLRGRERGFRNVCAPSVYVGHFGSKSFGQEKRALVVRNLRLLEQRFPKHRAECAAFLAADPLRKVREAIERVAAVVASRPQLLVTGAGSVRAVASERARKLAIKAQSVMILEVRNSFDGAQVKLFDVAGGMPQSLGFNLCSPLERESLIDLLHRLAPSRIELLDPANIPFSLLDILLEQKIPYDIFVADTGLLGVNGVQYAAPGTRSLEAGQSELIAWQKVSSKAAAEPQAQNWVERWHKVANGAKNILVPCPQAEAFAARILSKRAKERIKRCGRMFRGTKQKIKTRLPSTLGFVAVRSCAVEQTLIDGIAFKLASVRPDVSITVIGVTLDDIALMRRTNVFVTGLVGAEEFNDVISAFNLGYIFVGATRPLFGHSVVTAALSCPLPTAYFDWSLGCIKAEKSNLALDPRASLDDITDRLSRWISKP